ncbi:glycosyltransferase [Streptomyces sp. NPDC001941]|uniref:glycosyltransferase n=1 Tax=Streptomyces sp. NPDC001941 TaxID=3154659 RepID=UPI00332D719A
MTAQTRAGTPPRALAVAVPARNEEALLPAALRAIAAAARHRDAAPARILTVVAADTCTDSTERIAERAGALVVPVRFRNVGRARAAAVTAALSVLDDAPDDVWIASTDADTRVPPHWLAHQLGHAASGWDAVIGTVTVDDRDPVPRWVADRHRRLYEHSRPLSGRTWVHPHVHAANLGVTARAHARAGGFPPLPLHEDRELLRALERTGARVLRDPACPVTTSGRTRPRARGGFGDHLARLARAERLEREAASAAAELSDRYDVRHS